MARRSRTEPLPPTCPYCGTLHVEVIGREGLNDQLTKLRCTLCERTWSEVVGASPAPAEDDIPEPA
jgi:transposase-like protein